MRLLLIWFINAAALFAVPYLMHSVTMSSGWTALLAAAVLGLVNALIRPLLILLTPRDVFVPGLVHFDHQRLPVLAGGAGDRWFPCRQFLVCRGWCHSVQHHFLGPVDLTFE
jgi:hypothetical protein